MTSMLLDSIGITVGPATATYIVVFALVVIAIVLFWLIGLIQKSHDLVDAFYGISFAGIGWFTFLVHKPESIYASLILFMVSLHSIRLGYYLTVRWIGFRKVGKSDGRYVRIRKRYEKNYALKSLLFVMLPQAIVIMVVAIPLVYGIATLSEPTNSLSWLAYLGGLVFGIGLYYEWIADGQLQAFKADSQNEGRYLETGVWALTRHPNYFGNTVVWWGIWIVIMAGNPSIWWTVVGTIFNTLVLTILVGATYLDRYLGKRTEYKELMQRRNKFLPKLW